MKAACQASTIPGSLSDQQSNPSSSLLFYSIEIILQAILFSVKSLCEKSCGKQFCLLRESVSVCTVYFVSELFISQIVIDARL